MAAINDKEPQPHPTKILDDRVINLQECKEKLKPIHGAPYSPTTNRTINSNNNNNHHVVPVGIIIMLFTLYFTTTALQRQRNNENSSTVEQVPTQQLQKLELEQLLIQELKRRALILDKLLEHESICNDMEIFTKELRWNDKFKAINMKMYYSNDFDIDAYEYEFVGDENGSDEYYRDEIVDRGENDRSAQNDNDGVESAQNDGTEIDSTESSSADKRIISEKNKVVKRLNGKNANNNKSIKSKDMKKKLLEATKKSQQQQQQTKKNSTAEPIIYLFALVFIYLLLKAASDINQHYKSQTKGDKRLRRCSLQSYAQQHKQDRRASKDSPIKHKQPHHHRLMELRSKSVDRYTWDHTFLPISEHVATKTEMCTNLQQDPRERWNSLMSKINSGSLQQMSSSTNPSRSRGGSGDLIKAYANKTDICGSPNRRCSVPGSLNYQGQKINAMPTVPLSSVARRTSIASGLVEPFGYNVEQVDARHFPEVKRRVRMINRH